MSEIFITSDTHFCHQREFLYQPRGFQSVEEMNEAIVERWNEIVSNSSIVFHLGDMCLNDNSTATEVINRLNGKIYWLAGNHDSDNRIDEILSKCPNVSLHENMYATIIKSGKWRFYLSHYPTKVGSYDEEERLTNRIWNLCGHTHTQDKWLDIANGCYHCELDAHNCYPVNIEQIKEDLRNLRSCTKD